MRRDLDTIIEILKVIADSPVNHSSEKLALANGPLEKGIETETGRKAQIRAEHIRWMVDDGLLEPLGATRVRITGAGMAFLENVENEGVLSETKKLVAETGGSVALELIKNVASAIAKKQLERLGDIEL